MNTLNKLTNKVTLALSTIIFSPVTFAHGDSHTHIHSHTVVGAIVIASVIILSALIIKNKIASLKKMSKHQTTS